MVAYKRLFGIRGMSARFPHEESAVLEAFFSPNGPNCYTHDDESKI
jgi:hypothetical protein